MTAMLGRATAVLFSSLLLILPAFGQCTYQRLSTWSFRSSYLDLAIDGNDLWAATGYGVQLFDRSAEPLRPSAAIAVPGLTRIVRARDGVAYAGSGTAVYVVRKTGAGLEVGNAVELNVAVNDLLLHNTTLFAATTSGVIPIDVAQPLQPVAMPAQLSARNILSLARSDSALFAADGDTSVEVLTLSGSPGLLPITTSVIAQSVEVLGTRLYVSDGQQTEILALTGTTATRIGTTPFGAISVAAAGTNAIFAAGTDRRLRALDISALESPIDLFTVDVPFTSGTINRVTTIQTAGTRLYVGGGDTGLFAYDTAAFTPPFPSRHYFVGNKSSVVASNTAVYVSNATGGFLEMNRSGGSLTSARTFGGSEPATAHDTADDFLLTSAGNVLTYWTLRSTNPTVITTSTFSDTVQSAVLAGSTAYALLGNGSLWSADLAQVNPAPLRIGTGTFSFLARSGSALATAEITSEGVTIVRFYANGNFTAPPATASVPGAATTFSLGGASAALFTFRGITVVDFSATTPVQTVLPQSTTAIVTDLKIGGSKLLDVTSSAVRVWNLTNSTLERQFAIAEPLEIAVAADVRFAAVTTSSGVAALSYESASRQPLLTSTVAGNEFFRKAVGNATRLFLFDGTSVDVLEMTAGGPVHAMTTIPVPGIIDIAASDTALFTLSNVGGVTMYSLGGVPIRSGSLDGADIIPARIFAAGGAPWVAFSQGCTTTGCEHRTAVFDPQTLAVTALLDGAVIDSAGPAAIFELPGEIRVYDLTDPRHPSQLGARAVEGGAARVAGSGNSVFTLGDKLYTYSTPGLTRTGEQWTAQTPTAATRLALEGPCALVTGRAPGAELHIWSAGQWTPGPVLGLPSGARSIVAANERFLILTDHSVEIWSRGAGVPPPRRRRATR
jgi:hypothetical protein